MFNITVSILGIKYRRLAHCSPQELSILYFTMNPNIERGPVGALTQSSINQSSINQSINQGVRQNVETATIKLMSNMAYEHSFATSFPQVWA